MMLDCASFGKIASGISLVLNCAEVKPGLLRFTTIFRYPDGSFVDLFLRQDISDALNSFTLTDLGETTAYLLEMNIHAWKTNKRKGMISSICETLDVKQDGGELKIQLTNYEADRLGDAFVRLAQACIRVSDVSMTQTLRVTNPFKDDLEEFLDSTGYRYEVDRMIPGKFGQEVKIDFSVEGPRTVSLLQSLSAANAVVGRHMADDLFTRWYDIPHMKSASRFVTVIDANNSPFSEPDLRRIEELSTMVSFPDQQQELLQLIAA